jgi:hypothetical protein
MIKSRFHVSGYSTRANSDSPFPEMPKFSLLLDQRPSLSCDPMVHVPPSRSRTSRLRDFGMVLSFEPPTPEMPKCRCFRSTTHNLTRSNDSDLMSRIHVSQVFTNFPFDFPPPELPPSLNLEDFIHVQRFRPLNSLL